MASYTPGWARVDLLGHQTEFGYAYPAEIAPGQWMLAVQTPATDPAATTERFFGFAAIYAIVPTSEGEVRTALGLDRCSKPTDGFSCALKAGHDGACDDGLPF